MRETTYYMTTNRISATRVARFSLYQPLLNLPFQHKVFIQLFQPPSSSHPRSIHDPKIWILNMRHTHVLGAKTMTGNENKESTIRSKSAKFFTVLKVISKTNKEPWKCGNGKGMWVEALSWSPILLEMDVWAILSTINVLRCKPYRHNAPPRVWNDTCKSVVNGSTRGVRKVVAWWWSQGKGVFMFSTWNACHQDESNSTH